METYSMRTKAVIIALSIAFQALAEKPKVRQDPEQPLAGSIVFVEVSGPNLKAFSAIPLKKSSPCRTIQDKSGNWVVISQVPPDGDLQIFFAVSSGDELHHWRYDVTSKPGPQPPVPPVPGPTSPLAQKVLQWASTVESANRASEAKALAAVYRAVADNEQITTPDTMIGQTTARSREALGTAREAWLPFARSLASELEAQAKAGTLNTMDQHRAAWREIAAGLEGVR